MDLSQVLSLTKNQKIVKKVEVTINGHIRIQTAFMYPDGDMIDIFVDKSKQEFALTDFGESYRWIVNTRVSTMFLKTKNLKGINDIENLCGVVKKEAEIIWNGNEEDLMDGVVQLGQACLFMAIINRG